MKTSNGSSVKVFIWVLLMLVFTARGYVFFLDQNPETNESFFKKNADELFVEDDLGPGASGDPIISSQHWSIYSLIIFKEPLRDVLTPPPNC